jgi:hypothetical protein
MNLISEPDKNCLLLEVTLIRQNLVRIHRFGACLALIDLAQINHSDLLLLYNII